MSSLNFNLVLHRYPNTAQYVVVHPQSAHKAIRFCGNSGMNGCVQCEWCQISLID